MTPPPTRSPTRATRIVNAEPDRYAPRARAILASLGQVVDGPFDRPGLLRAVGDADVVVVRLGHRVDAELLAASDRLRVVVTATTGLDHVDLEEAGRRGIEVLSLRDQTDFLRTIGATSEHTWALLLSLLRRVPEASAHAAAGGWDRDRFRGRELKGRTLGIVGLGRIGEAVAGYARAFGMRVVAHDPFREGWPEHVTRCGSLAELLAQAEVLSVHVPGGEGTRHLIGDAELAALPSGALVVNTSRGSVIDEEALARALSGGALAGAALDVLDREDRILAGERPPLLELAARMPNVLVTPHIGGATLESMEATEVFMAERLRDHLSSRGAA